MYPLTLEQGVRAMKLALFSANPLINKEFEVESSKNCPLIIHDLEGELKGFSFIEETCNRSDSVGELMDKTWKLAELYSNRQMYKDKIEEIENHMKMLEIYKNVYSNYKKSLFEIEKNIKNVTK